VIAHVAAGDKADVELAVAAARKAFDHGPWTKMTPAQRVSLRAGFPDVDNAHSTDGEFLPDFGVGGAGQAVRAYCWSRK
jgi:aldehyde dehydrogenase family protein